METPSILLAGFTHFNVLKTSLQHKYTEMNFHFPDISPVICLTCNTIWRYFSLKRTTNVLWTTSPRTVSTNLKTALHFRRINALLLAHGDKVLKITIDRIVLKHTYDTFWERRSRRYRSTNYDTVVQKSVNYIISVTRNNTSMLELL